MYRRNLKGDPKPTKPQQKLNQISKSSQYQETEIDSDKKFKFSEDILNQLYEAANFYYPNMQSRLVKKTVNANVSTKLNQLHHHFLYLSKKPTEKSLLKSYDDVEFLNYDKYKADPSLFTKLDEQLSNISLVKKIII